MRIGVLSDLHSEPGATRIRSWINEFEPHALDGRLEEALDLFERSRVDLVLLLGDLTELRDESALESLLSRCARGGPVAAVCGNHDAGAFSEVLGRHRILDLAEEPFTRDGVVVAGLAPTRLEAGGFAADPPADATGAGVLVLASHYPLLSQAAVLAAAGLPYPRDLVNRGDLEAHLCAGGTPTVVVSGHIHARCTEARGPLLQMTVGALIEPPFECTVVEIEADGDGGPVVRRSAHRLGPVAAVDPVFTPDSECWRWDGVWRPGPS